MSNNIVDLDFREGDIVQVTKGKYAGRIAMIIGIQALPYRRDYMLVYSVKFSDAEGIALHATQMEFIRHSE